MDVSMDVRILEMGKFDISIPMDIGEDSYSDCYFDWLKLTKVEISENKQTAQKIFCYDELRNIKEKEKNEYGKGIIRHLQETMVLVSGEKSNFETSQFLYISMINVPMWNEDVIQNGDSYSKLRSQVFEKIKKTIKNVNDSCRLYYSFDHCDYVLIANGTKISYKDYLSILCKLRRIKIKFESLNKSLNISINAIHDITTVYGFGDNYISKGLPDFNSEESKLDLIARISFKNLDDKSIASSIESEYIFCTDVIGRYDCMIIWKGVTCQQINTINTKLKEQNDRFFCYSLNLGTDVNQKDESQKEDSQKYSDVIECINVEKQYEDIKKLESLDLSRSGLLGKATEKYKQLNNGLEKSWISNRPLSKHFYEIFCSINAMLKKDFSQYYMLSFYESFFSFFEFVLRETTNQGDEGNTDNKKLEKLEKLYEIYKNYFGFLNALTACTIHSERQFLQTDAYQMLYFDAPPKLIAFYTAIANKITCSCKNGGNKYTFLITPDFKEDIFVDSLTNDRTVGKEHNILIIHIDEKSLYDVTSTIAIITHEIFHHIGQDKKLRKYRAKSVIKCCLAYVISNVISWDPLKKKFSNSIHYGFYKEIIDKLYSKIFDGKINGLDKDDDYYYFSNVIKTFYNVMREELDSKDDYSGNLILFFRKTFCGVNDNAKPCEWFEAQKEAKDIIFNIHNMLYSNDPLELFSDVRHMFRESFADYGMLELLAENTYDKDDLYYNMLKSTPDYSSDEIPRIAAVMEAYGNNRNYEISSESADNSEQNSEKSHPIRSEFLKEFNSKKKELNQDEDSSIELFFYYMEEETTDYLKQVALSFKNAKIIKEQLVQDLKTLKEGDSADIVAMMDKEIFEYRKRLLKDSYRSDL